MSDDEPRKRRVDANATIQIDLAQVQLLDPNATPEPGASEPGARKAPPPLPPPLPLPGAAQAAPRSTAKAIAYVAMFVVLVGLAIVGGLMVGRRARGTANDVAPAPPVAAGVEVATPSAAAPSASAPTRTLTMPTIEMH